ncbi:perilipin 6 isoform 2-T12 [Spinachia spinachia]
MHTTYTQQAHNIHTTSTQHAHNMHNIHTTSTQHTHHIHKKHTTYTQHAHNIHTTSTQHAHNMHNIHTTSTQHTHHIHKKHTTSTQHAHNMHTTYTKSTHHTHNIHTTCTQHAHNIHKKHTPYTQHTHNMHTTCTQHTQHTHNKHTTMLVTGSGSSLRDGPITALPVFQTSAVLRVSSLPLVNSALQSMTSAYLEVKGRYPLLRLMGGVAEVGVRSVSQVAMTRATPFLQSLEPQSTCVLVALLLHWYRYFSSYLDSVLSVEVANSFVLFGLDRLEKNFPILNQSTEEVLGHLKDAFFLTLDDVQLWLLDGLDAALHQLERLSAAPRSAVRLLRESPAGQATAGGLEEVLTRLEDASAYYLPLPPTLRRQWEMKVQEYEDEDEDEPSVWTRVRSLLLNLSLQLYHRLMKVREQLQGAMTRLEAGADKVGLGRILELAGELLQQLLRLLVALMYRAEGLWELTLREVRGQAAKLTELLPVQRIRELPVQIQQLLGDLQELAKILVQLVINATPLYNLLQQPSAQEVEDFLNQEEAAADSSSRRGSASSLFLKAMDGRPRRRSLYSRAARSPQNPDPPNGRRRSSLKDLLGGEDLLVVPRRPSATELLLAPLKQFVAQSQKAFEYLSPSSLDDTSEEAEHPEEEAEC